MDAAHESGLAFRKWSNGIGRSRTVERSRKKETLMRLTSISDLPSASE